MHSQPLILLTSMLNFPDVQVSKWLTPEQAELCERTSLPLAEGRTEGIGSTFDCIVCGGDGAFCISAECGKPMDGCGVQTSRAEMLSTKVRSVSFDTVLARTLGAI